MRKLIIFLIALSLLVSAAYAGLRYSGVAVNVKPPAKKTEEPAKKKESPEEKGEGKSGNSGEKRSREGAAYAARLSDIAKAHLGTEVEKGRTTEKKVALTLDAGASSEPTPAILDVLKRKNIKVTFFLTGKWVEQNPELAKRIAREGHEIGNHSYSHPDFLKSDPALLDQELAKTETLIRETTGKDPKPFFRAPFGSRNQKMIDQLAQHGYFSVYWTVDSFDWKEGVTGPEVKARVLSALAPGAIILSHCGSAVEAQVLPEIIDEIQNRGYKIVRLSDVLSQ
ncbi:MAG: polysaccharide deacetylase family protein [Chloroflexi bacterium]|nr:polysaccharide deacetylase family protein [Chloroflexota bacterium]